jgi:hypothetical protein
VPPHGGEECAAQRRGDGVGPLRRAEGQIRRPEGGSEWELIKIIPEGQTRLMPQIHNQGFPHEFAKVA